MSLIFVDTEADGPCPGKGVMTEFGAVELESRQTFHGVLWKAEPDPKNPQSRNALAKALIKLRSLLSSINGYGSSHVRIHSSVIILLSILCGYASAFTRR